MNKQPETVESWARKWSVKEDDPLYGAILAVRESRASAAQAAQALEEIRAAIAQIPVAAEKIPKIIEAITTLSEEVRALTKAADKSLTEQRELLSRYETHTDHFLKMARLEEAGERRERVDAIAREVMSRINKNALKSSTLENWKFSVIIVAFVMVFVGGSLLTTYHLQAVGRLLPQGMSCQAVTGGVFCSRAPNNKRTPEGP